MKIVNKSDWKRKKHFEFFSKLDYPHFNITANLIISELKKLSKETELSFFKGMLYLSVKTANQIPEFKQRIRNEEIIEHDLVHPSYTSMSGDEVFSFTHVEYDPDPRIFFENAIKAEEKIKQNPSIESDPHQDDRLYITSIPWISFTSFTHPIHMNPVDSVPRISWGKFFPENGSWKIPLGVQAHHALVDGFHVGQYFKQLQEYLDNPGESIPL